MQFILSSYLLCKLLKIDKSSKIYGYIAQTIGPFLGVSRRANDNLKKAMEELNNLERKEIIKKMWNNLGRTSAEFFNLGTLLEAEDRISIKGQEILEEYKNKGVIFVSGHL
ncbi:MAG: lauroyl acyltransferase, partial [Pseudomonadota bacterium]|nr:lauroyl acyltransferase [Pseudomonadota bacterium]